MIPELGIIEGYYGRPWSWAEREDVMRFLAPRDYRFFLYAPKADPFLRRRWREPLPPEHAATLAAFGGACRAAGVRFGVGLSPYEAYAGFDAGARNALADKLAQFDAIGIDDLALLFDDMRGDLPGLADVQSEIVAFARGRSAASRVVVCPTYYTDDRVLDRVFGARPPGYLERLGELLDPAVEVFWTGEEVCSREIAPGHLRDVAARLGRRPFLWDNYPVNDGPRMSRHLHLRGFTGRPAANAPLVAAHAINPALQPRLSLIPALTLAAAYAEGDAYRYMAAFRHAAAAVAGPALAALLEHDLLQLHDSGLDRADRAALRARWSAHDHPAAREVVAWLDDAYAISGEEVRTQ
ncbi:MAG: GH84 [uncultured Sphingomonadaceae bacterium]|uniref:GH84 n=1 Tax=uncultured Sphingomonadaceae bacterium TaxID=169976 RepID=A0A6J4S652_9SPHN|nr:MAG: GH84 [uncultured Sphingomonadaceae bacterium]